MEQYINRLPLAEVTANTKNPRTISEARLQKLIDSLLVFPRMLYMRPVIIDGESVVLGGNMRIEALHRIARMTMNGNRLHHKINYRYLMPKILKGDGTVDNIPWDTYPEDYPFTNEPKRHAPSF